MAIDITNVVEAVIGLAVALITTFVIPFIKSKTTSVQRDQILTWVEIAVSAAEQIYKGSSRGAEKKQYVLSRLQSYGVTLNEKEMNDMIESAVHDLTAKVAN